MKFLFSAIFGVAILFASPVFAENQEKTPLMVESATQVAPEPVRAIAIRVCGVMYGFQVVFSNGAVALFPNTEQGLASASALLQKIPKENFHVINIKPDFDCPVKA